MKVRELIEMLKELDPEIKIFTVDEESDYTEIITPLYPAECRKYYSSSDNLPGYNCWTDWEPCNRLVDESFKSHRYEVRLTSDKEQMYVLMIRYHHK